MAAVLGILSFYGCGDETSNPPQKENGSCLTNKDCDSGICLINGKCGVYVGVGETCDDTNVCETGYKCENAVCVELPKVECQESSECTSKVCLTEGVCAELVNVGETCSLSRICPKDASCVEGRCVAGETGDDGCTKNEECPANNTCVEGKCVAGEPADDGCKKNEECPEGKECQGGKCVTSSGDYTGIASYSPSELADASASCKKADACMDNSECTKGANYAACECAQGSVACQTYPACKGIGDCVYECEGDYCSWLACANSEACSGPGVCNPDNLPANEDADADGIMNGIEIASGLDPCNADTDGDGVVDGFEDLNHDGVYQPDSGETDPKDPNSKREPKSQEGILVMDACKSSEVLSGGTTGKYNRFHLAKATDKGYNYYPDLDLAETSIIRFESDKVVGFFGSINNVIGTGQQVLMHSLDSGSYVENSAFKASVPLASWMSDKEGEGYNKNLQVVPDHTVDRYKYAITPNGKSLQEIAETIAIRFESNATPTSHVEPTAAYTGSLKCTGNATLYLARSSYENGRIYSGAITCDDTLKTAAVEALMDDVLSGTLVAPTRDIMPDAPSGGYQAYSDFVCQIEPYGNSSGKADFLWVIDNSGSMADELANLSKTVQLFGTTMKSFGIDFRVGVTTTDTYLLDEDPTAYKAYDEANDYKIVLDNYTYLNGVGFKQHNDTLKDFRGFLDILSNGKLDGGKQNAFTNEVTRNSKCTANGKNSKNICGFGFEDGLRSGVYTLSRVNVNLEDETAPDYYSAEDKANWDIIKKIKAGVTDGDAKKLAQVSLGTEENSLLYVIWVSDEESRQFKEKPEIAKISDSRTTNPVFDKSTGAICKTGYKLEGNTMRTGAGGADLAASACNPSMKETLDELIAAGQISEDSSMEELEAVYPEYADMLKYYIKQYHNFAQNREIVGFAFVGDTGRNNGGFCKELAVCKDSDCTKKDTDGSCLECTNWDYNNAAATVGANYGLSYIHMARFLSSYYPGNPEKVTKEGGKASICATDYNATVTTIAKDVVGRLGSHPLKGYPISSTIRVYRVQNNKAIEMTRNAASNGWAYDASQNAITFKNVQNIAITDYIAITYVIWKVQQG